MKTKTLLLLLVQIVCFSCQVQKNQSEAPIESSESAIIDIQKNEKYTTMASQLSFKFIEFSCISLVSDDHYDLDEYGLTEKNENVYISISKENGSLIFKLYTAQTSILSINIKPKNSDATIQTILAENNIIISEYPDGSNTYVVFLLDAIQNHDYMYWARIGGARAAKSKKEPTKKAIIDNLQYRTELIIDIVEHNIINENNIRLLAKIPDCYELYPIHYAIKERNKNIYIKALFMDKTFLLPVHQPIYIALMNKDYDAIEYLLSNGVNPLGMDSSEGDSAYPANMHILIAINDPKAIKIYLKYIENDKYDEESLQYFEIKNSTIAERLKCKKALIKTTLLGYALLSNSYEGIEMLIKNGLKIEGQIKVYSDDVSNNLIDTLEIEDYLKKK